MGLHDAASDSAASGDLPTRGWPAMSDGDGGEDAPAAAAAAAASASASRPPEAGRNHPRIRATRACDRCKKRKIRCSGITPCRFCTQAGAQCVFTSAGRRASCRRQPPADICASTTTAAAADLPTQQTTPSSRRAPTADSRHVPHTLHGEPSPLVNNHNPPVNALPQGDYVGPASGVSFLLNAQTRPSPLPPPTTNVGASQLSTFSFGDLQLHGADGGVAGCVVISREETQRLLTIYFDFTVPMDRFLHRPTVEAWCSEYCATSGMMEPVDNHIMRCALLNVMFALAQQHTSARPSDLHYRLSVRYFFSAEQALLQERGPACLLSVQVRLMQCLWLLSESRINHCWTLFGTTARLALAMGLHRIEELRPASNHIDVECWRRTFWSAYSLDNYLSMALGRSRIFHDEDIDQALPLCIDDDDVSANGVLRKSHPSQVLTTATVAYFKLGKIISQVLHDLYSARRLSTAERVSFAQTHAAALAQWRSDLPNNLDVEGANSSMLIPIFQRQKNVLTLAYHHTIILTYRQLLLEVRTTNVDSNNSHENQMSELQEEECVRACLRAASHIVDLVNNLVQSGQMFRAYWFTPYFTFSAIVAIYVYTVRCCCRAQYIESGLVNLDAATTCHDNLSSIADPGSLVERYCLVLERLRRAAMEHMKDHESNADCQHSSPESLSIMNDYTTMTGPSQTISQSAIWDQQEKTNSLYNMFNPDEPSATLYDFSGDISALFAGGGIGLEGLLSRDSF